MATTRDTFTPRGVFDAYHDRVCGFFCSRGFDEDEALDLTSQALAKVIEKLDTLRSPASLESWVMKVAANLWKNEIRYRKAEKRDAPEVSLDSAGRDGETIEGALLVPQGAASPLDEVLTAERLRAAGACLAKLPPRMRRCLVLHVLQDRKYQEVADALHLSIQSVKSHIHQARQHLKECVARRLAGESQ